jgi:hypothetical protein
MTGVKTTRRVMVTLTFATDIEEGVIVTELPRQLPPETAKLLTGVSAHAFDMADDDQPESRVLAVIGPDLRIVELFTDVTEAGPAADRIGGLVVELPVVEDHRTPDDCV